MPLIRGFSLVDEEGRVAIPVQFQREARCSPGSLVEVKVIRIKESRRWPHLVVHHPKNPPHLTQLQVPIMAQRGAIDEEEGCAWRRGSFKRSSSSPTTEWS